MYTNPLLASLHGPPETGLYHLDENYINLVMTLFDKRPLRQDSTVSTENITA